MVTGKLPQSRVVDGVNVAGKVHHHSWGQAIFRESVCPCRPLLSLILYHMHKWQRAASQQSEFASPKSLFVYSTYTVHCVSKKYTI